MKVFLCGRWDGSHIWLQWEDANPQAGYRIRLRFRQPGQPWDDWHGVEILGPYRRNWIVIPVWREGSEVEAAVAAWDEAAEPAWVSAQEVTFLRSRCTFRISTSRRAVRYFPRDEFILVVDGATCIYVIGRELELQPGESADVVMEAGVESGYCQLDHPGHFRLSPSLGLVIENLEPSVDDIKETGRLFSQIVGVPRSTPLKLVIGSANAFRGANLPENLRNA